MTLKRYPTYRESGIEWLGEIPGNWEIGKFRYIFRESSEINGAKPVGQMLSVSGYRGVETKVYDDENRKRSDADLETYRVVRPGQLAVNTMWLNYAGLGVSGLTGHMSPAYRAYDIVRPVHGRYIHHLMRCGVYVNAYTGDLTGIRPNSLQMSRATLMEWPVLLPPIEEQQQIADFLDAQTAKIDALIGKQAQLIETLAERRQAVISHAATKGLDPKTPMKDSGVAWLGKVPSAWSVRQVKYAYDVTLGKMLDAGRAEKQGDEALPYIRAANIQERGLDLRAINAMPFTPSERVALSLKKRDLLVVEGGAVGVCVLLKDDMPGWSFQKTVNRVRARAENSTAFLAYFLDAIRGSGVIDMFCNKSTISHFTAEKLNAVEVALPPVNEQARISEYLDNETSRIDSLSAKAREMINVLKERRLALISAAVTGKIDVRGLA